MKDTMTQAERPDQIATILKTVVADYPADMVANLDAYLVDLEARQSEQLKPITAILNTIVAELPLAEGASLTAYITWLETHQQAALAKTSVEPESLYWRLERRAAQRRERALRKLEYAQ
jgi:uncharacterized coiled-coil protein SlyX